MLLRISRNSCDENIAFDQINISIGDANHLSQNRSASPTSSLNHQVPEVVTFRTASKYVLSARLDRLRSSECTSLLPNLLSKLVLRSKAVNILKEKLIDKNLIPATWVSS